MSRIEFNTEDWVGLAFFVGWLVMFIWLLL
jgi:hypothetical protein